MTARMLVALLVGLALAPPALSAPATRGLTPAGSAEAAADAPLYARQVALVIGVDSFRDPSLDLSYAVRDAQAVSAILTDQYGFDEVHTLINEQATRAAVLSALDDLRTLSPDDALLIFWAGHGTSTTTSAGEHLGYLLPWDGSMAADQVLASNLSMEEVRSIIGRAVPARHKLMIVDACYSGLLTMRDATPIPAHDAAWLREATSQPVFQILTAGQADQAVLDAGPDGHSVFTARLLEALRETDDFVTASELAVKVQRRVRADAYARGSHHQNPAFGRIAGVGDFVLVPASSQLELSAIPPVGPTQRTLPNPTRWLAWGSGAALVIGAAGVTTAAVSQRRYLSADLSDGPQPDLYQLNRASALTGYTALGVGISLAGAAAVTARW